MQGSYVAQDATGRKRSILLGATIAQGAVGTIHKLVGEANVVAKLYKNINDLPEYQAKISAMLAAPPQLPAFTRDGRNFVQIAWPSAMVHDGGGSFRGFLMPEVDFQASTELENILQRSGRQRKQIPEFYGARVLLAANLAALMTELHEIGHYMVDLKPTNLRFYPGDWYMAIIDTDGFSINGARRMPAQQFSDEYIAPEARGWKPDRFGLDQDLFALAVIIFRLLNNGLHPFQGVDQGSATLPTTIQERIFAGLYAYGCTQHNKVSPAPSSIHSHFEDQTRELFDRAFTAQRNRPTAEQWRDHLNGLITGKVLVKCAAKPDEHAHFSKGCGLCAQDLRLRQAMSAARLQQVQAPGSLLAGLPTAVAQPAPFALPALYAGPRIAGSSGSSGAMPTASLAATPVYRTTKRSEADLEIEKSRMQRITSWIVFGVALGYYIIFFPRSTICHDMCGPGIGGAIGTTIAIALVGILVAIGSTILWFVIYGALRFHLYFRDYL